MAFTTKGVLLRCLTSVVETRRFRAKINIQRPKPVHFERAKFIALTKPFFLSKRKEKTPLELCKLKQKEMEEVDNPFQRIIAEELRDRLYASRLVAFYHFNPMKSDQQLKARIHFNKVNMYIRSYGKKTFEVAVKDTKYEPVLDFYVSHNMTVFSPDPDIKTLLKISKKYPQLVLLAAIFEGKFISRDEITELSLIPNLQVAQASLVQTLNSSAAKFNQQLNTHQTNLVVQLRERAKQLEQD